ncbi:MAG: UDP-N-acetyl-D-mannosamine dehydrogenase, partial [Proteobacteria bacterium]|nr:UDP-N-acetyl-D-mannosamine dehydrogenase [Pseudomonadota bacterium]
GALKADTKPTKADIFVIAVPTPFTGGHQPDLSYVEAATKTIAPYVERSNLIILESTSPIGTTEQVDHQLQQLRPDLIESGKATFFVAHCPERVLPGSILRELIENDRIVGGVNRPSTDKAVDFYETFVRGEVFATDARTAEMCKLVENSFRDLNIAFANELSIIAQKFGINVWELIRLANRHPRVEILEPGPGVGGHCLAVDPWFIVASAPEESRLIRLGREVNEAKSDWVSDWVLRRARRFREPVIAVLGLTYKPDIDDLRESPALAIARRLRDECEGEVLACDPNLKHFDEFEIHPIKEALERADVVVALVAHREFKRLDQEFLKDRVLIDACGVFR